MSELFQTQLVPLAAAADGGNAGGSSFMLTAMTLWLPLLVLFYFLLIRPQRREQSRRQQMLHNVKKNDRVLTAGGIYGVVTNVRRELDEVTIKVDETSNTKLRMTMSSISRVLGEEPQEESSAK